MKRVREKYGDIASPPFLLFTSMFNPDLLTAKNGSFSINEYTQTPSQKEGGLSQEPLDEAITKTDTIKQTSPSSSTPETKANEAPTNLDDMYMLSALLEDEVCETGITNPSEMYFRRMLNKNRLEALNTLSKIFLENYSTDTKKVSIAVSILHLISHISYDQLYPTGQLLALAAIGHKDRELAEYGIKCYENWGITAGVEQLKSVQFSTKWLQEYADQVILDLIEGE